MLLHQFFLQVSSNASTNTNDWMFNYLLCGQDELLPPGQFVVVGVLPAHVFRHLSSRELCLANVPKVPSQVDCLTCNAKQLVLKNTLLASLQNFVSKPHFDIIVHSPIKAKKYNAINSVGRRKKWEKAAVW